MSRERSVRCPHCHHVGPCIWIGYGKDWLLCSECQRRIRWSEVRMSHLLQEDAGSKGERAKGSYH